MNLRTPFLLCAFWALTLACGESFSDCTQTQTCDGTGGAEVGGAGNGGSTGGRREIGGERAGGMTSGGGEESGGHVGSGGAQTSSGGRRADECEEECVDTRALCDETSGECVECLGNEDCGESRPRCNVRGACEGCTTDRDCRKEGAPACLPDGSCGECVSGEHCGGNVCAPGTHTCTDFPEQSVQICSACTHDMECQVGQFCVEQSADGRKVGAFCMWAKDALVGTRDCAEAGRPFVWLLTATSVDGVAATLCTLRSTTCPAYLDFGKSKRGGCDSTGRADWYCGHDEFIDGICRSQEGASLVNSCTYPCDSEMDCPPASTCRSDAAGSFCSL